MRNIMLPIIFLVFCLVVPAVLLSGDNAPAGGGRRLNAPTAELYKEKNLQKVREILDTTDGKFSKQLRSCYLDLAEEEVWEACGASDDIRRWLHAHPVIRTGLLAANYPVDVGAVRNLAEIRKALGSEKTEKYAHLILAASLACRNDGVGEKTQTKNPVQDDFAETVERLAEYMQKHDKSLVDAVINAEQAAKEAGVTLPKKKRNLEKIWMSLGVHAGTFPQQKPASVLDFLKYIMDRYETKVEKFNDGGPEWPLFPIDEAPWPLLMPLGETRPLDECGYVWRHFKGEEKYEHGKKKKCPRIMTYGRYTSNYKKSEVRYKKSDWHPASMPRIVEDGGVCGRQSQLARTTYVALGKPAIQMGQPGHSALIHFLRTADGDYLARCGQSIAPLYFSTTNWYFADAEGIRSRSNTRVSAEFQFSLPLAVNHGLDRYADTRIALHIARALPQTERKTALLESALSINPYNVEVWYKLAGLYADKMDKIATLLERLDALLLHPETRPDFEEEQDPSEPLDDGKKTATTGIKTASSNLASVVRMALIKHSYTMALDNHQGQEQGLHFLKEEYKRQKSVRRSPYLGPLGELVIAYGIRLYGIQKVKDCVTVWVINEIEDGETESKADTRRIKGRISAVLNATENNGEKVSWLQELRNAFKKDRIFKRKRDGKVRADPLYELLLKTQIKTLRKSGKRGRITAREIQEEFDKARSEFERKQHTTP